MVAAPCTNCDGTPVVPDFKSIGPFPGVVQIAASVDMHELLTDPVRNAGAPAALRYHGGKVINNGQAKVFNIYMGPVTFDTGDFDAFTKAIVEDGFYMSPDGLDTTPGAFQGSITLPQYPFGTTVDDSAIQPWLLNFLASKGIHSDAYTLFNLIFPAGTTVTMQGSASCSAFCGYHTKTAQGGIYYAVLCDSSCTGCHGSFAAHDALMMVNSHEYGEWRSDPDGTGWYNDQTGMENGDECAWQLVRWGPGSRWAVQPLAVNGKGCYVGAYQLPGPPPPPPPPPTPGPTQTHTIAVFNDGSVKVT